jgi:hypothetical protein
MGIGGGGITKKTKKRNPNRLSTISFDWNVRNSLCENPNIKN